MAFFTSKELRLFLCVLMCCTLVYGFLFYKHSKLLVSRKLRRSDSPDVHLTIGSILQANGMSHLRSILSDMGFPNTILKRVSKRRRANQKNRQNRGSNSSEVNMIAGAREATGILYEKTDHGQYNASESYNGSDILFNALTRQQNNAAENYISQIGTFIESQQVDNTKYGDRSAQEGNIHDVFQLWRHQILQDTDLYASRREESTNTASLPERQGLHKLNEAAVNEQNAPMISDEGNAFEVLNGSHEVNLLSAEVSAMIRSFEADIAQVLREPSFSNVSETAYVGAISNTDRLMNVSSLEVAGTTIPNDTDNKNDGTFTTDTQTSDVVPKHASVLDSQAKFDFNIKSHATKIRPFEMVFPSGVRLDQLPQHVQETISVNSQNKPILTQDATAREDITEVQSAITGEDHITDLVDSIRESEYGETKELLSSPLDANRQGEGEQSPPGEPVIQDDQLPARSTDEFTSQEYLQKLHEHVNRSYSSVADQLKPKWTFEEVGLPKIDDLKEVPDLPLPHDIPILEQIGFMEEEDRNKLAFTTLDHVEDHFRIVDQKAAPLIERLNKELTDGATDRSEEEPESSADNDNPETQPSPAVKRDDNEGQPAAVSGVNPDKEGVGSGKKEPIIKFKSSMGVVPLTMLKEEDQLNSKSNIDQPDVKVHYDEHKPSASKTKTLKNTKVIFYSYLRGGSSIASELFNLDPQTFLWNEPLDAFYSVYFGIPPKTLPGNILYWTNGTKRELMFDERRWLVNFFRNMFECKLNELPADVLTHEFSHKAIRLRSFTDCYKNIDDKITISTCRAYTVPTCGRTIESSIKEQCHVVLEAARRIGKDLPIKYGGSFHLKDLRERRKYTDLLQRAVAEMRVPLRGQIKHALADFVAHQMCMNAMSRQIAKCLPKVTDACQKSRIRVAKVLRLRFDEMEELTFLYPDLKVIYLPRDPRGIAYSRAEHGLVKNERNLHYVDEAQFVCARMKNDLAKKKVLESRHPGKVLTITYEFLARHPQLYAERVYRHLNAKMPDGWLNLMKRNSRAAADNGPFGLVRRDPLRTALNWKKKVNVLGKQTMTHRCRSVLEQLNYEL